MFCPTIKLQFTVGNAKNEENNQSQIILPSVWLMVRLFFNRWAHEQFVVALVAEEVIRSVSFSEEKRISMKWRILISIFYFIWSLHEIFRFKKTFLNKNPRKVDFGYGNIGENSKDSRFPYIAPN